MTPIRQSVTGMVRGLYCFLGFSVLLILCSTQLFGQVTFEQKSNPAGLFTTSMETKDLNYTKNHEWILIQGNTATVGITDYAQGELGDIVFVDASEDYEGVTKHLVVINQNNIPFISGLHTIVAKNKTNLLQKDYLRYCFQTEIVRKQFLFYSAGAKVSGISKSNIRKIILPFPTCLSEQQSIASVLIDIDKLLDDIDKLILKKRKLQQGITYQLLKAQIRLQGYTGDWVVKKIEEIGQVGRGRVISNIEISKSLNPKYPVFSSQTSNKGIMGYIDSYDFDGDYVTWTTDGANAGTTFARTGRFNCTNVCGTIKLHDSNHVFIAALLNLVNPQYVSIHLGNPKLMNDIVKKIEIKIPTLRSEQDDIANIILDLDNELSILEAKRNKIFNLKNGVMQEILTGKTRLVKPEINND
mgnify:CR=1 FL=1